MADIEGIAHRIYDIIISPETVTGLINGGLSVPLDYGYLIYGIFDTGSRHERETERIRMMSAIRHDILNYDNIANGGTAIRGCHTCRVYRRTAGIQQDNGTRRSIPKYKC